MSTWEEDQATKLAAIARRMDADAATEQLAAAISSAAGRLEMYGIVGRVKRSPQTMAAITVSELQDSDPRLAAGAAQTVMELCWGLTDPAVAWGEPPDEWWGTPLGRLAGRALGHDDDQDDADATMGIQGAMELLGVSRSRVNQLLADGRLERGPDGRILRRTVGRYMAERDAPPQQ